MITWVRNALQIFALMLVAHGPAIAYPAKVSAIQYLDMNCTRLRYHFTVERFEDFTRPINPACYLMSATIDGKSKPASIDDVMKVLRSTSSGFDVFADAAHPDVIHVVDGRLMAMTIYPLNARLHAFRFAGHLGSLPDAIASKLKVSFHTDGANIQEYTGNAKPGNAGLVYDDPSSDVRAIITDASYKTTVMSGGPLWMLLELRSRSGTETHYLSFSFVPAPLPAR